ncbi:MAG: exonuclease domain-containing protein [Paraburkholderia tropica]|uniref:3'-5' exonuclease n=1 Tax=Paraburkholderia tropica TaxID=92647 RepID=UPI003100CBAA
MQQSAESSKPRSSDTKPALDTAFVAVIDTETTGLGLFDEPVSIGLALFEVDLPKGGLVREVDSYYGLREPQAPMSPDALAVHGLTGDRLAGQRFDHARISTIIQGADYVIAHNAEFDSRMLAHIVPEIALKEWRCSYRQIWWSDHIPIANRRLDTICAHLGIDRPNPHNALDDCRALAAALFTRTGKTNRSRTFLGVALSKGDFGVVVPPRQIPPPPRPMPPETPKWRANPAPSAPPKKPSDHKVIGILFAALFWFAVVLAIVSHK